MEEPPQPNDAKQVAIDQQLHPNNNKPVVPVDNPAIGRAVAVCSLLVFLSGAVLIVCWSVFFHPSNRQLWMVPFGLVLIGTPMIVWCSVLSSDPSRLVEFMPGRLGQKPVTPETAVEPPDLEK